MTDKEFEYVESEGEDEELDAYGLPVVSQEQPEYATLEDLTEANRMMERVYPQLDGKMVKFNAFTSVDLMLELQSRFQMGDRTSRRTKGLVKEVIARVLVEPRIPQDKKHLVLKMNAAVIFDILGLVMGANSEEFQAAKEDLGES